MLTGGFAVGTHSLVDYQARSVFDAEDRAALVAVAELAAERLRMLGYLAYRNEITQLPNLARFTFDLSTVTVESRESHGAFTHTVMLDVCPLETH
jgi:hypothetical protein